MVCALLIFGLVRRTLGSRQTYPETARGTVIAWVSALLWAVHPLQTATVTYIMQRSELLVSLCLVASVYAFARATAKPGEEKGQDPSVGWLAASVGAGVAGMACKEVMVGAPLVVLLYDRTFVAGSFRAAVRQRRGYYAALASSWLLLAWLVLGTENRGLSAGFSRGIAWTDYAATQLHALAHYLRLALWPVPLIFDYGASMISAPALLVSGALVVGALVIATLIAWQRWPAVGFCGAAFFVLLAPSSSVVPIATQTMGEHRVYLALAAPLVLGAVALHRWLSRGLLRVAVPLALALMAVTFGRNHDYHSVLALWSDTARKGPANPRAHYNLALAQLDAGRRSDALRSLARATELDPRNAPAQQKRGALLFADGRPAEALPHLQAAVRLQPESAAAHFAVANACVQLGRVTDALPHYAESVRLAPAHAAARYNLGNALAQVGRYPEALVQFDEASRLDPSDASTRANAARIRAYLEAAPR